MGRARFAMSLPMFQFDTKLTVVKKCAKGVTLESDIFKKCANPETGLHLSWLPRQQPILGPDILFCHKSMVVYF